LARRGNRVEFEMSDPFNPENLVRGYLHRSRSRRGDIEITHVNSVRAEQYISGAPTIKYLDRTSVTGDIRSATVFEKLDGTNILMFRYVNAENYSFVSYKTRLSPFLQIQPYGDFISMWNEIRSRYKKEFNTLASQPFAFSFELYGLRLRILTSYKTRLDARLLYAMDQTTGQITNIDICSASAFPMPETLAVYDAESSTTGIAKEVDEKIASRHKDKGSEGAVIYFDTSDGVQLRKSKPPAVMAEQAFYRSLYQQGKEARKFTQIESEVTNAMQAQATLELTNLSPKSRNRIQTIACEDITNELRYDWSSIPDRPQNLHPEIQNQQMIWQTIWGSQLWGMNTQSSDEDKCIVYKCSDDDIHRDVHQKGWHRKTPESDEHWYELGRVVSLIRSGSLTMLYGLISPEVKQTNTSMHEDLRQIVVSKPSKIFHKSLLRDVRTSERFMAGTPDSTLYLKHLRIACRNIQFGITLFRKGQYEFLASDATEHKELHELRAELEAAYKTSDLPKTFEQGEFDRYYEKWMPRRDRN